MNQKQKIITLAIIVLLISVTLTNIIFAQSSPAVGGGVGATEEYKNVTIGETFTVSVSAITPYEWKLESYDANYLSSGPGSVACGVPPGNESVVNCTYSFSFIALKEGKTTIELNKINTRDNSTAEIKYIYVTIVPKPPIVITHEYKTVTLGETFDVVTSIGEWKLESYDRNYLEFLSDAIACSTEGCSHRFAFKALATGNTTIQRHYHKN